MICSDFKWFFDECIRGIFLSVSCLRNNLSSLKRVCHLNWHCTNEHICDHLPTKRDNSVKSIHAAPKNISLIYNALIECMMNGIVRFSRSCKRKVKHTIKIFCSTRASSNFMEEKNLHKHYARLFQCWLVFVFASQSKQIFSLTARCNLDFMQSEVHSRLNYD